MTRRTAASGCVEHPLVGRGGGQGRERVRVVVVVLPLRAHDGEVRKKRLQPNELLLVLLEVLSLVLAQRVERAALGVLLDPPECEPQAALLHGGGELALLPHQQPLRTALLLVGLVLRHLHVGGVGVERRRPPDLLRRLRDQLQDLLLAHVEDVGGDLLLEILRVLEERLLLLLGRGLHAQRAVEVRHVLRGRGRVVQRVGPALLHLDGEAQPHEEPAAEVELPNEWRDPHQPPVDRGRPDVA
mmetsp:Transcript_82474/g.178045  ORF Transcript_82474/g.178045 Transcript_82474/m.178045 type:complete len:243 (-) Transcript_82474:91-819(-)